MKRLFLILLVASAAGVTAFAQAPIVTDVQDAASYTATIAQGGVFVVKGANLVSVAGANSASIPYLTSFNGVSITLTPLGGGTPVSALIVNTFSGSGITQVGALLPATTTQGDYGLVLTNNATPSNSFTVTVVVRKFGLITVPGSGSGRAVIQNVVSATQYDLNRFTTGTLNGFTYSPAKPGQTLITYGTGMNAAPGLSVTVIVGNTEITPAFAGAQGQFPGLDQINFVLPANIVTGCYIPFQVRVGSQLSNSTTIAIAPSPSATACVDPQLSIDVLSNLDNGGSITQASFILTSNNTTVNLSSVVPSLKDPLAARNESASGAFAQITADNLLQVASAFYTPAPCQVYHRIGSAIALLLPNTTFLDAGVITLNGPNVVNKAFKEGSDNGYSLNLGTAVTLPPGVTLPPAIAQQFTTAPVIVAGTYQLTGAGGKDVGKFGPAGVAIPAPLVLNNPLPASIPRSQNLTVSWTGGGPGNLVQIVGISGGPASNSTQANPTYNTQLFVCTTTADKLSLTVPASILSQIPATPPAGPGPVNGIGLLSVTSSTLATSTNGTFTAPLTAGGTVPGNFFGTIGFSTNTTYQ